MRLLLTSGGITNPSIDRALVDLLGKPIADCDALCIPTATYPLGGPGSAYRFILLGRVGFGAFCNKDNAFSRWMDLDTGQSQSSEANRSFWSGSGTP